MRALLFGGSGFIGRAVARQMLAVGWEVAIADSLVVHAEEPMPEEARFRWCDVRYFSKIQATVEWAGPDVIVWLAARQGYGEDWRSFAAVNVDPMYALGEVVRDENARRGDRSLSVVLVSSQAVYAPGLWVVEGSPRIPPSCYGLSKMQGEDALAYFAVEAGFRMWALRPSIVLGRGQSMDSAESGVLRNWARAVRGGGRPEVYGSGEQVRDFVHVEDVARGVVHAAQGGLSERAGAVEAVNLGGHAESVLGLWGRFSGVLGGEARPEVTGRDVRPGGEFSLTSRSDRAASFWGWRPNLGLDRQVRDFASGLKP